MAKKKEEVLDVKEEKKKVKDKALKKKKPEKVRNESFFNGVISEFKKVRWPNKKEMIKNSIATIVFILFFALFFYLIEIIIFFIKQAI